MSIFSNRFPGVRAEADAYTRSVIGPVGDRDLLHVLDAMPAKLASAAVGFAPADLARPEAPGK